MLRGVWLYLVHSKGGVLLTEAYEIAERLGEGPPGPLIDPARVRALRPVIARHPNDTLTAFPGYGTPVLVNLEGAQAFSILTNEETLAPCQPDLVAALRRASEALEDPRVRRIDLVLYTKNGTRRYPLWDPKEELWQDETPKPGGLPCSCT